MNDALSAFFASQIFRLPFLITCLVAIAIAIARYRSQGKCAAFAGWGLGLLVAAWLIRAGQTYWQLSVMKAHVPAAEYARVALIGGSASSLVELAGLILVIVAVFSPRSAPAAH